MNTHSNAIKNIVYECKIKQYFCYNLSKYLSEEAKRHSITSSVHSCYEENSNIILFQTAIGKIYELLFPSESESKSTTNDDMLNKKLLLESISRYINSINFHREFMEDHDDVYSIQQNMAGYIDDISDIEFIKDLTNLLPSYHSMKLVKKNNKYKKDNISDVPEELPLPKTIPSETLSESFPSESYETPVKINRNLFG